MHAIGRFFHHKRTISFMPAREVGADFGAGCRCQRQLAAFSLRAAARCAMDVALAFIFAADADDDYAARQMGLLRSRYNITRRVRFIGA